MKNCKYCQKELLIKHKESKNKFDKRIFCSHKCCSNSKRIVKTCEDRICCICNNSFKVKILKLNKISKSKRCSKCIKIQTQNIASKTKKELFNNRKNWQSARSSIQQNARKTFFNSNKIKECCICKYNIYIEIAHIKSVSSFNDETLISEINNINNLVGLCPNHHKEYDLGLLKIK